MQKLTRDVFDYHEVPQVRGQEEKKSEKEESLCLDCVHYTENGMCQFFEIHNEQLPDMYDMDLRVAKNGVCKAFDREKYTTIKSLRKKRKVLEEKEKMINEKGHVFID